MAAKRKPPSPDDTHDRAVGPPDLGAEREREREAERAHVGRREVGAWLVHRVVHVAHVADGGRARARGSRRRGRRRAASRPSRPGGRLRAAAPRRGPASRGSRCVRLGPRVTELLQRGEDRVERRRGIADDRRSRPGSGGRSRSASTSTWTTVWSGRAPEAAKWVPTARITSASAMSGATRWLTHAVPTDSGWRSSIAPLPCAGREDRRLEELGERGQRARTRRRARRRRRPRPAGARRRASAAAATATASGSAASRTSGAGSSSAISPTRRTPRAASRSRRARAVRVAAGPSPRAPRRGSRAASSARCCHAVIGRTRSSWSSHLVEEAEAAADAVRGSPARRSAARVTTPPTPWPGPSPRCTRRRRGRRTPRRAGPSPRA